MKSRYGGQTLRHWATRSNVMSAILVTTQTRPWFDYVRSQSNVADLPSRFELEELHDLDLIPTFYFFRHYALRVYGFRTPRFRDSVGCSYLAIMNELI
eukprot:scaffold30032_cov138-Isochrysis_galbana.AAC.9